MTAKQIVYVEEFKIDAVRFVLDGDRPVPADYDGDGKADIAVYRDGT